MIPIVLFCFNRPTKVDLLLNSLSANQETAESHLYVYIDGPRDLADKDSIKEVIKIITDSKKQLDKNISQKKDLFEKELEKEIDKAEKEIHNLKKGSFDSIKMIAGEISAKVIENITGDKLNDSSIKAMVTEISKNKVDKYL